MVNGLHVIAIVRAEAGRAALASVCEGLDGARVEIHVAPLAELTAGGGMVPDPDVLLLEVDPRDGAEVEHFRAVVAGPFAAVPVVATAPIADVRDVRRLFHLGAVDFLPQPIAREDLAGALARAARPARPASMPVEPRGRVIAILKAGGGAGATTLAVQTGCVLAARGATGQRPACVLDLDVQAGNAALYLDLDDRVGLADLLDAPERLDSELLRGVMAHHASGLDVLPAPREARPIESVGAGFVADAIELARHAYATVILDLPPVWTDWSEAAIASADTVVLVAELTVAGVRRARGQLDALSARHLDAMPVRLVLNRERGGRRARARLRAAELALGRAVDHFVPSDFRTVAAAIDRGVPLGEVKRRSAVARAIRALAGALVAAPTTPRGQHGGHARAPVLSLVPAPARRG